MKGIPVPLKISRNVNQLHCWSDLSNVGSNSVGGIPLSTLPVFRQRLVGHADLQGILVCSLYSFFDLSYQSTGNFDLAGSLTDLTPPPQRGDGIIPLYKDGLRPEERVSGSIVSHSSVRNCPFLIQPKPSKCLRQVICPTPRNIRRSSTGPRPRRMEPFLRSTRDGMILMRYVFLFFSPAILR